MKISWDHGNTWFERSYYLKEGDNILENFGDGPNLDELREASRQHGEPTDRLDLWQAGLLCSECGNEINGRFAADPEGDFLCWDCAMIAQGDTQGDIRMNTDPTKAVISESSLHTKSLCDHVINVATGCRHGCKFCYVPTTPAIESRDEMLNEQADVDDPQRDWGSYLLYRDDLPERLRRVLEKRNPDDWKKTKRGRGVVMLSSGTDCYQDRRAAQITRECVIELVNHNIPVRILTRSPAVLRDLDLYKEVSDLVTVGSSIPSFDASMVKALEPNAPPPMKRWEALDQLQKSGVPVYVSMSPTYPTMDEYDFSNLLGHFKALGAEVVFHEPINPRGANFQMCMEAAKDAEYWGLVEELKKLSDHDYWVEYALNQINMVQEEAERYDIEVHSWPDQQLIKATSGELRSQLKAMRRARSPEHFSEVNPTPSESQSPFC